MKSFLLKITVFIFALCTCYGVCLHQKSQGAVDEFYYKCTQETNSLILGLSRANYGISPAVLENELQDYTITNFAFNANQSPYGDVYLKAIENKISSSNSKNGIFIFSVSPRNFTSPKGISNQKLEALDKKTVLGRIENFTSYPNYSYMMHCYSGPLYSIFLPNKNSNVIFHNNGWNEFLLQTEQYNISNEQINNWKNLTLEYYKNEIVKLEISTNRINSLKATIDFLKQKGTVVLVRMPIDANMLELENSYWQSFDKQMLDIANSHKVTYLNYSDNRNKYLTYDGSHLESVSAKKFSTQLAHDIKERLF